MKTVKRIIAVLLLTLIVAVVGYLAYTGSRLTAATSAEKLTEAAYEQAENL